MKDTYLVFIIQGYDEFVEEGGLYKNIITLQIIAENYESAVEKAKIIAPKYGYRLTEVVEKEHGT